MFPTIDDTGGLLVPLVSFTAATRAHSDIAFPRAQVSCPHHYALENKCRTLEVFAHNRNTMK